MDYKKSASEILKAIGGGRNIVSAAHCATRLRLVIADNDKIKKSALENIDGVKGVFESSVADECLEIYLNDGEVVLSTRFYPQAEKISFGLTGLNGTVYQMKGLMGLPEEL